MKKYKFTLILLFLLLFCVNNVAATNNLNDFNKNITDNKYLIVISSNVDTVLNTVNNLINTFNNDINHTTLNKTVNKSVDLINGSNTHGNKLNITKNSKLDNKTTVNNFNITSDNSTTNVYPNTSSHQIKNNVIDNQFNKSNKDINKSLINKPDSKLNNDSSIINSTIHFNTSNLVNIVVDKNNKSNVLFNDSSDNINQFNKSFKLLGLNNISYDNNENNKLLYDDLTNKDVNISKNIKSDNITVINKINNHELSKFNNTTDFNKSSVINVYPDTSNLVNNSSVKYNKSNVLFNDTLHNQSQFNKSFKVFDNSIGLTNDSISKELNSSEINNISNNSSRDNNINHVSEPKQDKDYIMLLIPTILVLLGAIILYKKNK